MVGWFPYLLLSEYPSVRCLSGKFVSKTSSASADGRRMSTMMMNSLARISKMNESLVPKEMQVRSGRSGANVVQLL